MSDPKTIGEIDIMLENITVTLKRIEEQTIKTNGNLRKLQAWRSFLVGAWTTVVFILPFFWFLLSKTLDSYKGDILREVEQKISSAIANNNDKFFETTK